MNGRSWTVVLSACLLAAVTVAVALLGRRLVAVTVRGVSMEPTYRDGDRVLVRRRCVPRVGQVVVVERPMHRGEWPAPPVAGHVGGVAASRVEWLIKRVVAVPGDPVPRDVVPALADVPEDRVPVGRLVLLGDNRGASFDSAEVGYFPTDRVLGTVRRRLSSERSG
ncbi:MAG: S26 family signal peptidase [Saccharothrix sp.]|nr:S26 family signal peptidase [Saccharothrix sp.]